ncbi:MAG: SUMF1/EgtB/PvdO family nonheme iron enzyme [Treponema sp.]|nr:SUMF1/EgtB/PvdO family nonheme iron enzyme [Treponema sp.]
MKNTVPAFILFSLCAIILSGCTIWNVDELREASNPLGPMKPTIMYTVTYNGNEHTKGMPPVDNLFYRSGDTVVVSENTGNLEKEGHYLKGWRTTFDGSGKSYKARDTFQIYENTVLYAYWAPAGYTVTFDSNGGSGVYDQSVESGGTAPRPVNPPIKKDYVFGGWYSNPELTMLYDFTTPVTSNITLYAKWLKDSITNELNIELVAIPSGTFTMGPDHNNSTVSVTLSEGFYMGIYPVTQKQYLVVMGKNPSNFTDPVEGETQNKRPVENVSWYDAVEFCNKLSEMEGLEIFYYIDKNTEDPNNISTWDTELWLVTINELANGYRLPTEAQWEYACRAGSITDWTFGNTESNLVDYAWYAANASGMTHEVGKKLSNDYGLYDMHGNISEWCWDWYGDYPTDDQTDYTGAVSGGYRVRRGGSLGASASGTRSAYRDYNSPESRQYFIGFRVVLPFDGNTHTHTWDTWSSSATQHWKECTISGCDAKTEFADHAPANGICTTCGYVHTHSYEWLISDGGTITKTCSCGGIDGNPFTLKVGDTGPAGGIIFYVAPSGFTVQGYSGTTGTFAAYTAYYLEAAPANESNSEWGAYRTSIAGVTTFTDLSENIASLIGNGRRDTKIIVNHLATTEETGRAAQVCANKTVTVGGTVFKDWFLPSLGELNEMYKAKEQAGISTTGTFWSSSQNNSDYAWTQAFINGSRNRTRKDGTIISVYAVRAF